jgi:hypothetical protein
MIDDLERKLGDVPVTRAVCFGLTPVSSPLERVFLSAGADLSGMSSGGEDRHDLKG